MDSGDLNDLPDMVAGMPSSAEQNVPSYAWIQDMEADAGDPYHPAW